MAGCEAVGIWRVGSSGSRRNSSKVLRRSLVFRESASSDTTRANDIAPTSALKLKIALDLAPRCRCLEECGNQLNVVPELFGGDSTGLLIAARDLRRKRAEGTARAGIVAVRFAQIVIDQLCERYRPAAMFCSVHSTFPAAENRANRFGNQIVARIEVLVEPALP